MHRLFPVAVSGPVLALAPRLLFVMAPLVTERGPQVHSPQWLQRVLTQRFPCAGPGALGLVAVAHRPHSR